MTVKKIIIGQKIFLCHNFYYLGKSDTENSNFAKILTFGQCLPEIRAFKVENDQKSEKMDQKCKNGPKVQK